MSPIPNLMSGWNLVLLILTLSRQTGLKHQWTLKMSCNFFYSNNCIFYSEEPWLLAVCCKKQNQFILCTTHFWPVYVPKSSFFCKKLPYRGGALLKKHKKSSRFFLNSYRYHKNVNRFEFPELTTIKPEKNWMKNKSKIWKSQNFLYLGNHRQKMSCKKLLFFKKIRGITDNIFRESFGFGRWRVKG